MQFYSIMSIVLPIVGLVGAGMSIKNPKERLINAFGFAEVAVRAVV